MPQGSSAVRPTNGLYLLSFYTGLRIECLGTKMKCVQQLLERTLQFQDKFLFPMNTRLQNGTREHTETSFPVFSKFEHVVKTDYKTRVVQLLRVPLFANI